MKCFVQLVSQCFGDIVAGQVERNISQCNSAFKRHKTVAKRKVEPNSTFGNGSCHLSRNDFGRCRVCYTVKCFVQLVPPQCRQNIARQVARNISQCNSALTFLGVTLTGKQKTESLKTEHTTNFNIPFNQ